MCRAKLIVADRIARRTCTAASAQLARKYMGLTVRGALLKQNIPGNEKVSFTSPDQFSEIGVDVVVDGF
jgi:hypothetical protein